MKISRSELAVITILNVLIAALIAVIFLLPRLGIDTPPHGDTGNGEEPGVGADVPADPPAHEKLRPASPGKTDGILRETQLMGSGDESVLGVFGGSDGGLYVFGNATVGDYDFDGYGGFVCRLDEMGKITAYEYLTGRLTAVGLVEGGFAAATAFEQGTENERNTLYYIEYDKPPREVAAINYTVLDIAAADNGRVAVVSQRNDNCITLAEYVAAGAEWKKERSTDIASGYTLEYFDCYMPGAEYTVAVRASSLPMYDSIAFFTFTVGGDPTAHFYGGSGDNLLRPYAVLPSERGYIVTALRGGHGTVIGIDYTFTSYRRTILDAEPNGGTLVFDGKNYYATFSAAGGGVSTYVLDTELTEFEQSAALGGKTPIFGQTNTPLFVVSSNKLEITYGNKTSTLDIHDPKVHYCKISSDGTFTAVMTADGGSALGTPIGGRDVYILALTV